MTGKTLLWRYIASLKQTLSGIEPNNNNQIDKKNRQIYIYIDTFTHEEIINDRLKKIVDLKSWLFNNIF